MSARKSEKDDAGLFGAGLEPLLAFTNYERVVDLDYNSSKFDLSRMMDLLAHLGNPQAGLPAVHLAGTKGKGSTAIFTASILKQAGVRVGLFTSPHLERIEERFELDGRPIETVDLVRHVQALVPYLQQAAPPPTFFEIITAIAWSWFRERGVEVPVMEVGLGGRLDSTNVLEPAVCLITNIGIDHTRQLGGTLDLIAAEKAGIIKKGVPVITAALPGEGLETIRRRAEEMEAPLTVVEDPLSPNKGLKPLAFPGRSLSLDKGLGFDGLTTGKPLAVRGRHQRLNAACAVEAVRVLASKGIVNVSDEQIRAGLTAARLPGRIEQVAVSPAIILDGAHNGSSAHALAATLGEEFRYGKMILLFAILADKQIDTVLKELIPLCSTVIFTRCASPRSAEPEDLAGLVRAGFDKLNIETCNAPREALARARVLAGPDDLICVAGSTYLAGELRPLLSRSR